MIRSPVQVVASGMCQGVFRIKSGWAWTEILEKSMSSFSEPHLGSKQYSVTTRDSLSRKNRCVNFKDINGTFNPAKQT
jgi:hypothetical protein